MSKLDCKYDFLARESNIQFRKHRNPSFPIAPHCTIKPHGCYCLQKDGLKHCEVTNYNESCAKALVTVVLKIFDKTKPRRRRYKDLYLTTEEFSEVSYTSRKALRAI